MIYCQESIMVLSNLINRDNWLKYQFTIQKIGVEEELQQKEVDITVFMAVYNSGEHLKEAIDSILLQTFKNFELLIIDDGSTDNSLNIVESYDDSRIRLIKNEGNKGIPYTRNRGIENARGKYIAILDSDDIACSVRLEKQYLFMEKNKDFVAVASRVDYINNGNHVKKRSYAGYRLANQHLLYRNIITNSSSMIRKDFLIDKGIRYSAEFKVAEDYLFWTQLASYGKIAILNQILTIYRIGNTHYHITGSSPQLDIEWQRNNCVIKESYLKSILGNDITELQCNIFNEFFTHHKSDLKKEVYSIMKKVIPVAASNMHINRMLFWIAYFLEVKRIIRG